MNTYSIGIIVGSLRKQSYNRKIAEFILEQTPNKFNYHILEIGDLPLYNQDFDDEGNPPESYIRFRKEVAALDAILFITPEYNRSVPAVLKNAIDVGSRPYGKNKWDGKPGAIISSSTGDYGGFGANHHIRQSLVFVNIYPMQQPEAYLGNIKDCIGESGKVELQKTKDFLLDFKKAFEHWIIRIVHTKSQD
ncbi:NAD(P)H-dependent oxidoreductase [Sphingobacterium sp. ML3W]|uniref:NADPH-dependent FMN reductase n=1 Tax=Sphingobacterium sp. ML3W TaxID=1538644 RepID=UPI00249B3528|nr:NAD(P)H-dependent oxidoreductase [Sphingobacterium sp. ML3W]WFA80076.1 NAD(P)H-dependent oxidoreductase [Sphingobacterium sp. ML3W]